MATTPLYYRYEIIYILNRIRTLRSVSKAAEYELYVLDSMLVSVCVCREGDYIYIFSPINTSWAKPAFGLLNTSHHATEVRNKWSFAFMACCLGIWKSHTNVIAFSIWARIRQSFIHGQDGHTLRWQRDYKSGNKYSVIQNRLNNISYLLCLIYL
jgi:hypothetical protein